MMGKDEVGTFHTPIARPCSLPSFWVLPMNRAA
jgi:hypothetical protein